MHSVQNMKLVVFFSSIARNILGAREMRQKRRRARVAFAFLFTYTGGVTCTAVRSLHGKSVFFEALIPSSCSPVSPAWLTSPQNLHSMVERVADDHASSLVDNNSAHRMIKATVAAALRSHNTHVRTVSVPQHMNSVRSVFDNDHFCFAAAIKCEA